MTGRLTPGALVAASRCRAKHRAGRRCSLGLHFGTRFRMLAFAACYGLLAPALFSITGASAAANDKTGRAEAANEVELDRYEIESDLPALGRSVFDLMFVEQHDGRGRYHVPFPFSRLRQAIAERIGDRNGPGSLREVLIPIGRALQRNAAAPDFFRSPRIVLAVVGEPSARAQSTGEFLKDRLFIGYQERAQSLEVISYNEALGRFEFQVVDDYAAGETPKVFYARRSLCLSCHQNAAPIFAEPAWSETNANADIAERLLRESSSFHGLPVRVGERAVEDAREISSSVQRANLIPIQQRIWRDGCGRAAEGSAAIRCRAALLALALQYRLSSRRHFDGESALYVDRFARVVEREWRRRWSGKIEIPNPLIPDIDPLRLSDVAQAGVDPLEPRDPATVWLAARREDLHEVIDGISQFVSLADAKRLDDRLDELSRREKDAAARLRVPCAVSKRAFPGSFDRLMFRCGLPSGTGLWFDGEFYVKSAGPITGRIQTMSLEDGKHFDALDVTANPIEAKDGRSAIRLRLVESQTGLRPRRANGNAVAALEISWRDLWIEDFGPSSELPRYPDNGQAVLTVERDFTFVLSAIDSLVERTEAGISHAFADGPFRRAVVLKGLFSALGLPAPVWPDPAVMDDPPAEVKNSEIGYPEPFAEADRDVRMLAIFHANCGLCHRRPDPAPPNFLYGTLEQQEARIEHCAERIFYRLAMWGVGPESRLRSPMPPLAGLNAVGLSAEDWKRSQDLESLTSHVVALLQAQPAEGDTPPLDKAYPGLRACLP